MLQLHGGQMLGQRIAGQAKAFPQGFRKGFPQGFEQAR